MTHHDNPTISRTSGASLERYIRGHKLLQSEGDAWQEIQAQIFRRAPHEDGVLVPALAEPLLVWITTGSAFIEERELNGEWTGRHVSAGDFFLTHADAPYMMRWRGKDDVAFEVLHLYIDLSLIARAGAEIMGNPGPVHLRDISGASDTVLSGLLVGLRSELAADRPASATFVQGIAQSLAIHLVRHYAEESKIGLRPRGQLPAFRLRRAIVFMEAHLSEAFDLEQVALAAGMSRFHFSRAFRSSLGQSPSTWFIRRRIAQARQLLRETDRPIIAIGLDVGYASPSHFAQIFRRETGISPRDYRLG